MNKNFKLALLAIATALLFTVSSFAQESATPPPYKIEGNQIVSTKSAKAKAEPVKTEYTHTIKGKTYPVYRGAKGGLYIIRVSKKSGKEYKQYLKTR